MAVYGHENYSEESQVRSDCFAKNIRGQIRPRRSAINVENTSQKYMPQWLREAPKSAAVKKANLKRAAEKEMVLVMYISFQIDFYWARISFVAGFKLSKVG